MSPTSNRIDKAHEISYPTTADARGSTRVSHLRRPYYLGPFESPQSYIMFGLWKHRLLETGTAPETKDLRPIVEQILKQEPTRPPVTRNSWFVPSLVLSTVSLSAAIIIGCMILSTNYPSAVDNEAMTASEIEFVRGLRMNQQKVREDLLVDRGTKLANLTTQLLAEGPNNAAHHRRKTVK